MQGMTKVKAFAFDLFGTIVDITSISKVLSELNIVKDDPKPFIETWRSKQLQYAWLLTLIGKFEPFGDLSIRALKFTSKVYNIELSDDKIERVRDAQLQLEPFPDSKKGLQELARLKKRSNNNSNDKKVNSNYKLSILSNGESSKANKLLSNISLIQYFDHILSAEEVGKYKPAKEVYTMASERLNLSVSEIALVSSNLWDIAGGQEAGMQTCWINRQGKNTTNEELDLKSDYIISSIEDLKHCFVL
jgi:2-haloacid dehalogenase